MFSRLISEEFKAPFILCLFVLLVISCSTPPASSLHSDQERGVSKDYAAGPVVLHQQINRNAITVAERIQLTLEATAPENVEIKFPSYSASLGDFNLKETRELPAEMTGSGDNIRVKHRITYILEPYLPGTYIIPAMNIIYRENPPSSGVSELETEQIDIPVKSLLPQTKSDKVAIKDIKSPYDLPPNRVGPVLMIFFLLFLTAIAVYLFYTLSKRKRGETTPESKLSPAETAERELDGLLTENLLAKGAIKLFHLRISDILRRYIENRFGVKAPERTTEEFLLELSGAEPAEDALLSNHKVLLADFLTQCDLVKFAKHQPSIKECEKTVTICQEFIEKTKE